MHGESAPDLLEAALRFGTRAAELQAERELANAFAVLIARLLEAELRDWPTPRMCEALEGLDSAEQAQLRRTVHELVAVAHLPRREVRRWELLEGSKLAPLDQARRHEAIVCILPVLEEEVSDWPTPRMMAILGDLDDERQALLRQTLRDFITAARAGP